MTLNSYTPLQIQQHSAQCSMMVNKPVTVNPVASTRTGDTYPGCVAARLRSKENQFKQEYNYESSLEGQNCNTRLVFVVTHQTMKVFQEGQDIHQFRVVLVREPAFNGYSIFQVISDEEEAGGERKRHL